MADEDPNIDKTPADEMPKPPKTIAAPVPPQMQTPDPDQTEAGQAYQKEVNESQLALQQIQENQRRVEARQQELADQVKAGMRQVQTETSEADKAAATPPALLPMQSEADYHAHNQIQWSWPNTLFTLGIGLAGALGKHGHGTLSNYFLGSFFQAYAAGQEERQKEMLTGWTKTNEEIYKENQTRISEYRATLQDKRLSIESKRLVLQSLADQLKDPSMLTALQKGDLTAAIQAVTRAEKALNDYRTSYHKTWDAVHKAAKENKYTKDYDTAVMAIFHAQYGEGVTPTANDIEEIKKYYTLNDYLKAKKFYGTDRLGNAIDPAKTIEKKKAQEAKAKPSASATPSATPTDSELDNSIDAFFKKKAQ